MPTDKQFSTGAVRSADADSLDFLSIPLLGLIGVARTAHEGGKKYGRFNYMLGMPAHECVNHAAWHIVRWAAGDRSEPHLSHAAWNLMAADQSMVLDPELNSPHLPGPGYTITEDIREHLASGKPERDRRRQAGEFADEGKWSLDRLPEVQAILKEGFPIPETDESIKGGFEDICLKNGDTLRFTSTITIPPDDHPHRQATCDVDLSTVEITPDEVRYAVERVGAVDVKPGEFLADLSWGLDSFFADKPTPDNPAKPCEDCDFCVAAETCRLDQEPLKKVIYLSGPMSGIPKFNFPEFNAAAKHLRDLGYRVINPADFGHDGKTWAECLARDLAVLPEADLVLTLPGWGKSRGARLEVHVARELGIEVAPFVI